MATQALVVIPARMGSSRYPGKPKAIIRGRSMLERVWKLASAAEKADRVVIATDDEELKVFAESFGAEALMTSSECRTGTDRVAESATLLGNSFEIVFSFQGDAVLTPPWIVDDVLSVMKDEPKVQMATPACKLQGEELRAFVERKKKWSAAGTCVTFRKDFSAMYFSNSLIPFDRKDRYNDDTPIYRHIGLYAYTAETLSRLSSLPDGEFENVEKLEQLRALEHGIPIRVVPVNYRGRTPASVDYPEDVSLVESIIDREGELVAWSE